MAQQKAVGPAVDEVDDLIDELQPGAKLLKGQYTITRYINSGGFGITYLAKDSLDRDVVIKECFPGSVCRRSKVVVAARSRAHTAELRSIVQLFVREARNLAKIVHPNIVAVHQVFEDNGTAYMAIDFIDGLDLQQIIEGEGPQLSPEHIVKITDKLLHAVGFIHEHDMLHRDISPDNVLINQAGEPILIDFGAAREKASQTNRAMSALRVVKDGYSPQEFYIAGSEQGPWSDLYALGATLYHLISGDAPINGQARLAALAEDRIDPYVPLTGRFTDYPKGFLEAIDRAMCTLPKQRLQTAREWLAMFRGGPVGLAAPAGVDDAVNRLMTESQRDGANNEARLDATTDGAARIVPKRVSRQPELIAASAAGGRRTVQLAAGVAVALVVVVAGYMMLNGNGSPPAMDATAEVVSDGPKAPVTTGAVTPTEPEVLTATAAVEAISATPTPATATETATAPDPATTTDTAVEPAVTETEAAAVEPAVTEPEVAAVEPVVTEPEVAAVEPALTEPEVAAVEPAVTEPVAAAVETAAAPVVAEEPVVAAGTGDTISEAAPETTTEPTEGAIEAASLAAPVGKPVENQIALAAWDVYLPFISDNRIVGNDRVAVILRIPPNVNLDEAGSWLQPGLLIFSVNGVPTDSTEELTLAVMNAMKVDPDGKARVVVEYAGSSLERQTDLLTVTAVRLVNLANGVSVQTSVVDGVWKSEVTGIAQPEMTTLRQGDILFRDKSTAIALDGSFSLEDIVTELVGRGTATTEFAVIRDNKVSEATMHLVVDGGQ